MEDRHFNPHGPHHHHDNVFDHRLDHNVPPHHHHPDHDWIVDRCADRCDDQLPLFSQVGRGLQGDGFLVRIKSDSDRETILEGLSYDPHTGAYTSEWTSENINGGKLSYAYNLRPYDNPTTFTMTFKLERPNRPEWAWTTPPIPYVWDADNDGQADVDGVVGVGISTLFIKKTGITWDAVSDAIAESDGPNTIAESLVDYEKLLYPSDWARSELNAPLPGDPYTVNLEYGIGGDLDAPNIDDLAKIIGVTPAFLRRLVAERDVPTTPTFGENADHTPMNVKEYIDKGDEDTLSHLHADLGWPTTGSSSLAGDGGTGALNTVKKYVDDILSHFHKDLFNGIGSTKYNSIPSTLRPLSGDSGDKTVWDWILYAIDQAKGHLHNDLFGNKESSIPTSLKPLKGDNGTVGVWDWILYAINQAKDYTDDKVEGITIDVENPKLYKLMQNVKIAFYAVDTWPESGLTNYPASDPTLNSWLINNLVTNATPIQVCTGKVYISYFDLLPQIEFDFEMNTGQSHAMDTGEIGVICMNKTELAPLDFRTIVLPNRKATAKNIRQPLLNPENMNNTGYHAAAGGNWQIFTGVGDLRCKVAGSRAWPWMYDASHTNAYMYIFNRNTGSDGPAVSVDYARTYNCSYNMATLG